MQRNKRLYKTIFSVIVLVSVVFSGMFLSVKFSQSQLKADTNYAIDLQPYVINDWQNYTNQSHTGITIANNGDGTLTVNGTATALTEFTIPTTITTIYNGTSYDWWCTILNNNEYTSNTSVRMYLGYNNGANVLSHNSYLGRNGTGTSNASQTYNDICLVLRFNEGASFTNTIFTPLFLFNNRNVSGVNITSFGNYMSISTVNTLLGPTTTPIPADLTKCVYVAPADVLPEARAISTMINSTFNDNLENLIEFAFETGFIPNVDTTGLTNTYIDLISFEDSENNNYYMRFNNDYESANYLNIDLYINNDSTPFYNDNLGEISNQNITNFRVWATYIINNECTITTAQGYNNNILEKIYVYILGTANYRAGYEDGYGAGTLDGWEAGLQDGYTDGYTDGYGIGKEEGYNAGQASQIDTSWLMGLFDAVGSVLAMELLPNLTIGMIVGIPFVISVIWFIIRQLRGGGGE